MSRRKFITEETDVKYSNINELSYYETGLEYVDLYIDSNYAGEIEIFTDRENENREYICLNYEMVYLDTIEKI